MENTEETQEPSLRDTLVAAMAEHTEPAETAAEAESRARDERGRFAPAKVEGAKVEGGQIVLASEQQTEVADPPIAPPKNLKPELHEAWGKSDRALQKYLTEREEEVHKGFTRMDDERQFGRTMREAVSPYAAMIQAEGADPVTAVKSLLNTAYVLRSGTPQQKMAALQQVAQQYQIPLENIQQQQRIDPQYAQLHSELQQLKQQQQQSVQQREQAEQQQILSTVAAFAAEPGHEHFEQVKPHMAALLSGGLATSMQDAYDQAVWAHPQLRQTVQAAQQHTAEAEKARQAAERTAAAKRAGASVAGTPGVSVPVAAPSRSLREEIAANLAAARAH